MCSKTLGPAKEPSLVMWPTMTRGVPVDLAQAVKAAADSLICPTEPGTPSWSGKSRVWTESTTTSPGCSALKASRTAGTWVWGKMSTDSSMWPNRLARNLTCSALSSPLTYNTLTPIRATASATCSIKVDLPMPGSPPSNTTPPGTAPPPKTRSNSLSPMARRGSSSTLTSFRGRTRGACNDPMAVLDARCDTGTTTSSSSVFQALQLAH